jgi:hypothetical protein
MVLTWKAGKKQRGSKFAIALTRSGTGEKRCLRNITNRSKLDGVAALWQRRALASSSELYDGKTPNPVLRRASMFYRLMIAEFGFSPPEVRLCYAELPGDVDTVFIVHLLGPSLR